MDATTTRCVVRTKLQALTGLINDTSAYEGPSTWSDPGAGVGRSDKQHFSIRRAVYNLMCWSDPGAALTGLPTTSADEGAVYNSTSWSDPGASVGRRSTTRRVGLTPVKALVVQTAPQRHLPSPAT